MTRFDRLAWRCSWVAPAAWTAALALFILAMAATRAEQQGRADGWRGLVPVGALVAVAAATLAHLIVHHHAVKAGSFPSMGAAERSKLEVALRFRMNYARWRDRMRSEHPELRTRHNRQPQASGHGRDAR